MKQLRLLCCAIALLATSQFATANCLTHVRLTGVNLAGAEFNSGKIPGVINKDYTYPRPAEYTFVAAKGANVIRLPFRWERLQPTPMQALNGEELQRLRTAVTTANASGLCVILDVHNYAKYNGQSLSDNPLLQDAFVDLWLKIATAFPDAEATIFDLMNEPNYLPIADWAALAKRTLASLRKAKAQQIVLIAGGRWSGIHDWFAGANGTNAELLYDLNDPLKRTIIEVHQYADRDFSGTGTDCRDPDNFIAMFEKLTEWADTHHQNLFLGEFGVPPAPNCLATLEHMLRLVDSHVWRGWTYWAGGSWWGNYKLALNSDPQAPSPQWEILSSHFFNDDDGHKPQKSTEKHHDKHANAK